MKEETLSKMYAQALLELAQERGELERIREEVAVLEALPRLDPSARIFFETPNVPRSEKLAVLDRVLRGRFSDTLVNFVLLAVRRGRAEWLRAIYADFRQLYDKAVGHVHVTAVSAVPLSEPVADALAKTLQDKLRKKITVENKVKPEILGGLIVRYEGMVADGSLLSALEKVAAGMKTLKFGSQLVHEN